MVRCLQVRRPFVLKSCFRTVGAVELRFLCCSRMESPRNAPGAARVSALRTVLQLLGAWALLFLLFGSTARDALWPGALWGACKLLLAACLVPALLRLCGIRIQPVVQPAAGPPDWHRGEHEQRLQNGNDAHAVRYAPASTVVLRDSVSGRATGVSSTAVRHDVADEPRGPLAALARRGARLLQLNTPWVARGQRPFGDARVGFALRDAR